MSTGVSGRRGRSWGVPHICLSVGARQDSEDPPGLESPHFLLAGFSLFSPPFKLFKGDLPFQVVDELRAEPRHVCGVQIGSPRTRDREPKERCLPDAHPRRGAESRNRASSGESGPACAAAAALGFRGSAWRGRYPWGGVSCVPPPTAAGLRPPASH